mgnify:CR=1 FL=1
MKPCCLGSFITGLVFGMFIGIMAGTIVMSAHASDPCDKSYTEERNYRQQYDWSRPNNRQSWDMQPNKSFRR